MKSTCHEWISPVVPLSVFFQGLNRSFSFILELIYAFRSTETTKGIIWQVIQYTQGKPKLKLKRKSILCPVILLNPKCSKSRAYLNLPFLNISSKNAFLQVQNLQFANGILDTEIYGSTAYMRDSTYQTSSQQVDIDSNSDLQHVIESKWMENDDMGSIHEQGLTIQDMTREDCIKSNAAKHLDCEDKEVSESQNTYISENGLKEKDSSVISPHPLEDNSTGKNTSKGEGKLGKVIEACKSVLYLVNLREWLKRLSVRIISSWQTLWLPFWPSQCHAS